MWVKGAATSMKAILYVGHGTRSKNGAEEVREFMGRIMERSEVPIQELCFLELTDPPIEEGFRRCVERGATEIIVVPLFLLAAGHIKEDIPKELALLKEKYPGITIKMKDAFGVHHKILDGMAELIRNTVPELSAADSVLIVGRGSSDPGIHVAFSEIVCGIRDRLPVNHVSVCYLAAAKPSFDEGLEQILQMTQGQVVVLPYLLFSGLLLSEVNHKVLKRQKHGQRIVHTGPLSKHRVIEDLIIDKASE